MAEIVLKNLTHSYLPHPNDEQDWALKELNLVCQDGGSYALLGPSGCGKTTLLNIISGLLSPTSGSILFDGRDVSTLNPEQRDIAQVFQFPVVYDTMTVFQNLAFPLRNRGIAENTIKTRVHEIAEMLELNHILGQRAQHLTADSKQKISLGRSLVRSDVNVIMFDEPLTVIDPHLKWQFRSKLKQLHQRFGFTMIYVTHDQTEALTLADQIVVLHQGKVVQSGSPEALFERPEHTFVGHFIGSPGMNQFPATIRHQTLHIGELMIPIDADLSAIDNDATLEVGIRPEHIRFSKTGFPIKIRTVSHVGRYHIVAATLQNIPFKVYLPAENAVPSGDVRVSFDRSRTHLYLNGWLCQPAVAT